ncbi:AI-2E family transporter [Aliirhizobium cellulosilyticum]|uniref:Putative PurR-regulated permease PerM n=1 Tax=Aliirhizobium cellulosilyticum TaxID=393664 RepID=A0A7W6WQV3_9HYPH|nr:AI-2E family transporter [Rhizobium cellulosilyticum]MBB4349833.1 putative PurR-regulated permease PerM [Rhizobium cellulosilyticum]MBB4414779.1 putative PurR-regulated permease PerM [Rhizobium cellulosilyticum]MBB4449375.1 putative PurR-regulated permease PerM [Rhizobium cellulosilyticum]
MQDGIFVVQRVSFYILLVLVTLAFIAILIPFYSAVFWAVVFAIIFFPLYAKLEEALGGRRNSAAVLSVLICLCLVILPGLAILASLIQEGTGLYQRVSSGQIDLNRMLNEVVTALPAFMQDWLQTIETGGFAALRDRFSSSLMQGGSFFAGRALNFGQSTAEFFIAFGLMLYLLFFLFRDGRSLAAAVRSAAPLSDEHTTQFMAKFASVVRATVRGNIIIAIIQGVIGGVTFWLLGVQPALLWGVLMVILSLVPAVGAALVWVPTAIYLAVTGEVLKAAVIVAVGVFVIGLIDNILRPPLVGKETKLPDYVVLISTVGGISLFGVNGFVIGPLIAALFIAAWSLFEKERGGGGNAVD